MQRRKLFLFQPAVKLHAFLGAAHHRFYEIVLIVAGKPRQPFDLTKHHLFQKVHTDIMGRGTGPPVALIVGTVEILDIGVALVEMEVEVIAAIGTHQQTGKHIAFPIVGTALAYLPSLLLDLLPHGAVNDRLMHILENDPVFTVILDPLFVLIGFGIGLEVEDIAAILLQGQYLCDGGAVPFRRRLLLAFSGPLDALLEPIGPRGEDTFPLKLGGDLLRPKPVQGHAVNVSDHLGRFIVHDPTLRIVGVFNVPVGRLSHRLTSVPLDLVADAPLLTDIASVPLVEQIADRSQLIFTFGGVDVVGYRHQADIMFREKFLGQSSDLYVVAAQTGKVLYEHGSSASFFKLTDHLHKTGAVHRDA